MVTCRTHGRPKYYSRHYPMTKVFMGPWSVGPKMTLSFTFLKGKGESHLWSYGPRTHKYFGHWIMSRIILRSSMRAARDHYAWDETPLDKTLAGFVLVQTSRCFAKSGQPLP